MNDAYETTSNDVYNNPIPGSSKEPVFSNDSEDDVYNNPMPGSSNKPVFINESDDDISEISNLFNSDDSVADPDFSLTDLFNTKKTSRFRSKPNESSDEEENPNDIEQIPFDIRHNILPSLLPADKQTTATVYIASYPESLIFTDQEQANLYKMKANNQDDNACEKTTILIAQYPGPIYLNNDLPNNNNNSNTNYDTNQENDTDRPAQHVDKDEIVKLKMKNPFIEETCGEKCRRDCGLFSIEERKSIWNKYWGIPYNLRRNFLNKCTRIQEVKRRRVTETNPDPKYRKNETRLYFLPKNNEEINVCRSFFLKTLGHKTDAVLTELSRAIKRKQMYGEVKENRGGKKSKINRNSMETHILSYQPAVSHYRRSNAPLARYLPRTLSITIMYKDYKTKYPVEKGSMELYRQKVKDMNISLKFPKGDRCGDCAMYEEETKKYSEDEVPIPDDIQVNYMNHKTKADKAIKKYQEDASKENTNSVRYYSIDLQKVMLLPDMPKVKDSYFLSRLVAFNLTLSPLQKKTITKSCCILWHEAFAGRDANNIVDALVTFIEKERDLQHLNLWCDNCTSQNKNWIIYTALVSIVNSIFTSLESVTIKYLTKGHTHMSADGVHGNIESQIRRQDAVYDFDDYKNVISKCRKNIEVLEVQKSYEWTKKKRAPRRNQKEADPLISFLLGPLVEVKFINGSKNMFYKYDFDEPYQELDFLMKKHDIRVLPRMLDTPRGIKESKKEGIVKKLVPLMPMNRRDFWLQLPTSNDSQDLVTGGQIIDNDI